jgi:hypothetical protein
MKNGLTLETKSKVKIINNFIIIWNLNDSVFNLGIIGLVIIVAIFIPKEYAVEGRVNQ